MIFKIIISVFTISIGIISCDGSMPDQNEMELPDNHVQMVGNQGMINTSADSQAVVINVISSGTQNNYTFDVKLKSPDTGCDQYADWWEIIDENEELVYRRILTHSHVDEQPFIRSGGPVKISNDQRVYIRGHMNHLGYGSLIFSGSITNGFEADTIGIKFAANLEMTEPLPDGCAF